MSSGRIFDELYSVYAAAKRWAALKDRQRATGPITVRDEVMPPTQRELREADEALLEAVRKVRL